MRIRLDKMRAPCRIFCKRTSGVLWYLNLFNKWTIVIDWSLPWKAQKEPQ